MKISIKQKSKYHFILPGRIRKGSQFWFPISISGDFAISFDGNRTCISVFSLSQHTQIHMLSFAFQIVQPKFTISGLCNYTNDIICTLKNVKSKVFTFVTCKSISCSLTHFKKTCFLKGLDLLLCYSSTPVVTMGTVLMQCLYLSNFLKVGGESSNSWMAF